MQERPLHSFVVDTHREWVYHIDKIIRENGAIVDDGLHEIFVNTTVNDGTAIADLMSCFIKKEFKKLMEK